MRLVKHGFSAKKGKFGYVKVGTKKHHKGSKKMRAGSGMGEVNPASVNSPDMIKMVVPQHLTPLDRALLGSTGGKRRKSMKGGVVYGSGLSPADVSAGNITGYSNPSYMGMGIDGQGITNYGMSSNDVQLAAGQAGGKRRKHRKMWGGTTSRNLMGYGTDVPMGSPLNAALNAV
jgi:hypothetical protein